MDLKYTRDYIVDEASAAPILDDTERSGIAADHRGMVKFDGKEAPGFRTVVAALKRWARDAPGVVGTRNQDARDMLRSQGWRKGTELVAGGEDRGLALPFAGSGRVLEEVGYQGGRDVRGRSFNV